MGPSFGEGMVPNLERTQVGIALGDFITSFNSGMGLLHFPEFGFVGHYDQGWFALAVDVPSEILRVPDSR